MRRVVAGTPCRRLPRAEALRGFATAAGRAGSGTTIVERIRSLRRPLGVSRGDPTGVDRDDDDSPRPDREEANRSGAVRRAGQPPRHRRTRRYAIGPPGGALVKSSGVRSSVRRNTPSRTTRRSTMSITVVSCGRTQALRWAAVAGSAHGR